MRSAERYGQSIGLIRVRMKEHSSANRDESEIIDCAELLRRHLRPDDTVGRMGIYEFLIVLAQNSDSSCYHKTFERIIERCHTQSPSHLEFVTVQSQSHEKVRDLLNRLDAQPATAGTIT